MLTRVEDGMRFTKGGGGGESGSARIEQAVGAVCGAKQAPELSACLRMGSQVPW